MNDVNEDHAYNYDFDGELDKARKDNEAARHIRASAYHHVFAQDAMGQKILTEWVTSFCTGSPPPPSASEREVGMMDGKRELVKLILDQISIVTGEEHV